MTPRLSSPVACGRQQPCISMPRRRPAVTIPPVTPMRRPSQTDDRARVLDGGARCAGSSQAERLPAENPYAPHRRRSGKAPRPAHDSHVGRRKARRALEGPSEPAHTGRHRHCRGRRRHVGGIDTRCDPFQRRLPHPRILRRPALASRRSRHRHCPRRHRRVDRNARRRVEDRLRAHDPGGEIGRLRQARAGPPSSLGPDGRLAARRAWRSRPPTARDRRTTTASGPRCMSPRKRSASR